jgi:ribosomal-protein-alanine N-acetyltransferase
MAGEAKQRQAGTAIRAMRVEDLATVMAILRLAPEAVFWSEANFKEALKSESGLALVCVADGRAIGFLIGRRAVDEAEILNLAVEPGSRRRGEGGFLLETALREFRSRGVTRVFLEVRESNEAASAFYSKHGFAKTGRRPGYYRDPAEAAILMENKLAD